MKPKLTERSERPPKLKLQGTVLRSSESEEGRKLSQVLIYVQ